MIIRDKAPLKKSSTRINICKYFSYYQVYKTELSGGNCMKKKKRLLLVLAIVIVGGCFVGKALIDLLTYEGQVSRLSISDVNLSMVGDGVYTGSYDAILVSAKVRVTVKNHRIEGIELVEHNNGRGKPAEVIPDKVLAAQSLEVDVISGATSSSKVILKAIENALNSTPE